MPYRAAASLAGHLSMRTIAISEYVAQFVRELRLAPPSGIRVVRYGLDATGWKLSAEERHDARCALGLEDDEVAVGVASRLVADKGHAFLIEAVQRAMREAPQLRLIIAGVGPMRVELDELARSLPEGSVRFLGFLPSVRRFMNACDIFAFPTLPLFGEGFGLAALEAMAAARPVVATNTGPLPEIVVDGTTGLLVSPGAVDELARVLTLLGSDRGLRQRLGAQGRERAKTAFSLERMVHETMQVYEELDSLRGLVCPHALP
jgi:glycosyltransferase involved in cell wall biosynthesis